MQDVESKESEKSSEEKEENLESNVKRNLIIFGILLFS